MPNLSVRQEQLLQLLQTRLKISTEEIKSHFSISAATASREIHALVLAGEAVQVSHGIKLAPPLEARLQQKKCFYCGGMINDRTVFIIQMEDGSQRSACCAHCGLLAIGQPGTQTALVSDFIHGRILNARQAIYVLGSMVNLCCEPSVLCFASREEAQCFRTGFGGSVFPLYEVIAELKDQMKLS
jgi:DeoR family transcriptional regulator, copper-sensing transcriptional repressor